MPEQKEQSSLEGEVGEMVRQLLVNADEIAGWGAGNEAGSVKKAAALLQSLSADNARLREERDAANAEIERMTPQFVAYEYLESPAGREAAEARLSEAVEVLKPFATLGEKGKHVTKPDECSVWGFKDAVVTWGDFRAARQFLDTLKTPDDINAEYEINFLDTQGGGNG